MKLALVIENSENCFCAIGITRNYGGWGMERVNGKPCKILVASGERDAVDWVKEAFTTVENTYDFVSADTLPATRGVLRVQTVELIISDWSLPDGKAVGLASLPEVRGNVPVLVLAEPRYEPEVLAAVNDVIVDYCPKHSEMMPYLPHIVNRALHTWELISERRAAEQALMKSEAEKTLILNSLSDAVLFHDMNLRIHWSNQAAHTMPALEPAALLRHYYASPNAGPDRSALARGENCSGEFTTPDGRVWVVRSNPVCERSGKLQGVVEVIRDMTEEKQVQHRLKEQEERYRRLTESVTDYIFHVRIRNDYPVETRHSSTCVAVTGYSAEAFEKDPNLWIHIVPEADRPQVRAQAEAILLGKMPEPVEHRIRHRNGQIRWVRNTSVPHHDVDGRLVSYDGLVRDITERKRAELALRESNRKFQLIFQHSLDAIFLLELETGRILDTNPTAEKLLQYRKEAMLGHLFSMFYPRRRQGWLGQWRRLLQEQGAIYEEGEYRRGSGDSWPMELTATSVPWEGRKTILVTLRDASKRLQAEEALRESEQRYAMAVSAGKMGIWDYRPETNTFYTDDNLKAMYGYASDELSERLEDSEKGVHPHDKKRMLHSMREHLNGQTSQFEVEYRAIRKDGTFFWAVTRGSIVAWNSERPSRVMGTVSDISLQKQVEEERARLVETIEQAAESIMVTNVEGMILYVNPAFERTSGYGREEILGEKPRILKSGKHDAAFYEHMWRVLLAGNVWKGRITNRCKDGSLVVEETTISPLRGGTNEIEGFVALKQDISYQMELEKQLRQAQKMEAIGTIAGGIAHDFNNILYAVIGYADLAKEDIPEDSRAWGCINEVRQAGKRAAELVNQILTVSRQTEQERVPMYIQPVLKEALKLLHGSIPATISIESEIDETCGAILGDPTQIHQVIMNLCTNAYHAMREKGGKMRVLLQRSEVAPLSANGGGGFNTGNFVRLSIEDSGCGMSDYVLERIFDPYFTTKKLAEGTGLGLAMVHGIVQLHGGSITVHSEEGKGSTFYVYFPEIEAQVEEEADEVEVVKTSASEHVLFVDDEASLVTMIEMLLKGLGYRVSAFTESAKAWQAFEAQPDDFDIVVTDQTMPGMTGAELSQRILALRSNTPIVLCTGFSEMVQEEEAKKLGISEYMRKPIVNSELVRIIGHLLEKRRGLN